MMLMTLFKEGKKVTDMELLRCCDCECDILYSVETCSDLGEESILFDSEGKEVGRISPEGDIVLCSGCYDDRGVAIAERRAYGNGGA